MHHLEKIPNLHYSQWDLSSFTNSKTWHTLGLFKISREPFDIFERSFLRPVSNSRDQIWPCRGHLTLTLGHRGSQWIHGAFLLRLSVHMIKYHTGLRDGPFLAHMYTLPIYRDKSMYREFKSRWGLQKADRRTICLYLVTYFIPHNLITWQKINDHIISFLWKKFDLFTPGVHPAGLSGAAKRLQSGAKNNPYQTEESFCDTDSCEWNCESVYHWSGPELTSIAGVILGEPAW